MGTNRDCQNIARFQPASTDQYNGRLSRHVISIKKIRRSFIMGIHMMVRRHLYIETVTTGMTGVFCVEVHYDLFTYPNVVLPYFFPNLLHWYDSLFCWGTRDSTITVYDELLTQTVLLYYDTIPEVIPEEQLAVGTGPRSITWAPIEYIDAILPL